MGKLNMLKEWKPQGCLTKGFYAWCHTRWRGLESHLLLELLWMTWSTPQTIGHIHFMFCRHKSYIGRPIIAWLTYHSAGAVEVISERLATHSLCWRAARCGSNTTILMLWAVCPPSNMAASCSQFLTPFSSYIVGPCTCTETMALNGYINICILWQEFSNRSPVYSLG